MSQIYQNKGYRDNDPVWRNEPDKPSLGPVLPGEGFLLKVRYGQTTPAENKKQMDERPCYCMDESGKFGIFIRHEEKPVMYHYCYNGDSSQQIHPNELLGVVRNSHLFFEHWQKSFY
jgi:hypothetical protein